MPSQAEDPKKGRHKNPKSILQKGKEWRNKNYSRQEKQQNTALNNVYVEVNMTFS